MNIEEITTWTADEALANIRLSLPKDWVFQPSSDAGFVSAVILDGEGTEQWICEEPLPDPLLIYLEAYGWLHTRTSTVRHPIWNRRGEIAREAIKGQRGFPTVINDPEDVDPSEIEKELDKQRNGQR